MPRISYDEMWDPWRYLAQPDKRWRCAICGYDAVKLTKTGGPRAMNDHNLETGDCSYRKIYGVPGENVPPNEPPEPTPVINHGNGVRTQYHSTGAVHRGVDYRESVATSYTIADQRGNSIFITDETINWEAPTVAELERVVTSMADRLGNITDWMVVK